MSLPFDPEETGPWDIYRSGKGWVTDHSKWLIGGGVLIAVALIVFQPDVSTPEIPTWARVFVATGVIIAGVAYSPAKKFVRYLHERQQVTLLELSPMEGDLAVHRLSPDRFAELTVVDGNDDRQGTNYLSKLTTKAGTAFECKRYDAENNVAKASWLAGKSYKSIREKQKQLEHIETEQAREADKFLDLRVNHGSIIRRAYREVINRQIKQTEKMTVPDGEVISETIEDVIGDLDATREGSPSDEPEDFDDWSYEDDVPSKGPKGQQAATDGGEDSDA